MLLISYNFFSVLRTVQTKKTRMGKKYIFLNVSNSEITLNLTVDIKTIRQLLKQFYSQMTHQDFHLRVMLCF